MAEIISHEFGSGNNVDSNARGMGGLCEKEPLNTCRMSRKSTNDEDPHMYETLDESEFRIRLLNSLGIEQGIMDSKGKRKKTKVSLKEQLCTVVLIAMATCLVVSNVTLLFLFMNAKSPCTDAGMFFLSEFVILKICILLYDSKLTDELKTKSYIGYAPISTFRRSVPFN